MDELDFDKLIGSDESDIEPQELTVTQRELIGQYLEKWRVNGLSTEPIDREQFNANMSEFYRSQTLEQPIVVWLEDPWEVTALFSILSIMQGNFAYIMGRGPSPYGVGPAPLQRWAEKWLRSQLTTEQWNRVWKVFDEHRESLYETDRPLCMEPASTANDKFYYPMFSECCDAIELFRIHYIENEWNELWNQAESDAEWVLRTGIERPIRRFIAEEFRHCHTALSNALGRQLRSQYLTENDFETLKILRTEYDGIDFGKELSGRTVVPSLNEQRLHKLKSSMDAVLKDLTAFDDLKFFAWQNSSPVLVSLISALLPDHFQMSYESQTTHRLMQNLMNNSFVFLPVGNLVLASDRPAEMRFDQFERLHCETGPALVFRGGLQLYFWHGIRIPEWVIREPERLTVQSIESEKNAEVRTVLVERYGEAKFLMDAGAILVHEDEYGTLYQKFVDNIYTLTMVKVTNSTANPDGTRTNYFLRVPNEVATAKEAVAWTFGLHTDEYNPLAES